jgi:nicotinate-nucleotide adenylyltransferase
LAHGLDRVNSKPGTRNPKHLIGVFGGTFDPIHYGHLRPAREAYAALGLAELRFIPAGQPPHRHAPQASAEDRLAMLRLAIAGEPGFVADERELGRGGPSYTVPTLESLRAELGSETPLCLLIGADAFAELETWHRWQRLPELAHFAVLRRPGCVVGDNPASWPDWARARTCRDAAGLARAPAGRVMFVNVSAQDISATRIRARIARGESPADSLPAPVWQYIRAQRLYRIPETKTLEAPAP